jgi:hypothetical protein
MDAKLTPLAQHMVTLCQLVADTVLLATHSINGEFWNFCICFHMHCLVVVQFAIPISFTMHSPLTRRKCLYGLGVSGTMWRS